MSIELNHIIIPARSKWASATFLADILASARAGPQRQSFVPVKVSNGVTLDYVDAERFDPHHCAFLASEGQSSTPRTRASAAQGSRITPGRMASSPVRSTTCAAAGASTSMTPTGTTSRSPPGPTTSVRLTRPAGPRSRRSGLSHVTHWHEGGLGRADAALRCRTEDTCAGHGEDTALLVVADLPGGTPKSTLKTLSPLARDDHRGQRRPIRMEGT